MEQGNNKSFLSDEVVKEEELSFLSDEVVTEGEVKKKVSSEATSGVPTLLKPPSEVSTSQSGSGGLDFSQTPSEILAKETPKEVKSLPKVNPNNARAYEYAQKNLHDADKTFNAVEHQPDPILKMGAEQQIKELKKKKDYQSAKASIAQKAVQQDLDNISNYALGGEKAKEYIQYTDRGIPYVDNLKLSEYSAKMAKGLGVQEDGYFKTLLYNDLVAKTQHKIIEPVVEKKFNELHKQKFGSTPEEYQQKNFAKGFKAKEAIEAETKTQLTNIGNEIKAKADAEVAPLNKVFDETIKPIIGQANQQLQQLGVAYQNGQIPREQYEAQFKQISEQAAKIYEEGKNDYLSEMNKINNKYNSQFERQQNEVVKIANERINKEFEQYKTKYKADPKYLSELKTMYGKAYKEAAEGLQEARGFVDKTTNPVKQWVSGYAASLGNSISGLSTSIGFDGGAVFGDYVKSRFQVGDGQIKGLSDLLDPNIMINSTSQLAGGMTASMGAAIPLAMGTGGLGGGLVAQGVVGGLVSWATETMDIAGNMYKDRFAETGSVEKASKAADQVVQSQSAIMITYGAEMLPFLKGALSGIKSKALRVGTGAGIEYGTEMLQEYPQNVFEQNIRAGREYSDIKALTNNYTDFSPLTKQLEETALNLIPIMGLGAVGQLREGDTIEEKAKKWAKSQVLKEELAKYNPSQQNQFISQITAIQGDVFAQAFAESMFANGSINEEQKVQFEQQIAKVKEIQQSAQMVGLDAQSAEAYGAFLNKEEDWLRAAENTPDVNIKANLLKLAAKSKEQALMILDLQGAEYATVTYPSGETTVWSIDELNNAAQDDLFLHSLLTEDIKINIKGEGKGVAENINNNVEEYRKRRNEEIRFEYGMGRDFQLQKIQTEREKLGIKDDIFSDLPESIITTLEDLESGKKVSVESAAEASDLLYGKYKELSNMEGTKNRMLTTAQIKDLKQKIGQDITLLENYISREFNPQEIQQIEVVAPEIKVEIQDEIRNTDNNIRPQVESPQQEINIKPIEVIAGEEQDNADGGVAKIVQGDGQGVEALKSVESTTYALGKLNETDFNKIFKLVPSDYQINVSQIGGINKSISELYHESKANNSNPQLVEAVEQLLNTKPSPIKEGEVVSESELNKKEQKIFTNSEIESIEKEINELDYIKRSGEGYEGELTSASINIQGVDINYNASELRELNDINKKFPTKEVNGTDVNWEANNKEQLKLQKTVLQRYLDSIKQPNLPQEKAVGENVEVVTPKEIAKEEVVEAVPIENPKVVIQGTRQGLETFESSNYDSKADGKVTEARGLKFDENGVSVQKDNKGNQIVHIKVDATDDFSRRGNLQVSVIVPEGTNVNTKAIKEIVDAKVAEIKAKGNEDLKLGKVQQSDFTALKDAVVNELKNPSAAKSKTEAAPIVEAGSVGVGGDFKIDDKDTFYHASNSKRVGRLKPSTAKQFGTGVYFTTNKDLAISEFGEEVTEVKLALDNPVYTNTKEWSSVEKLALEKANEGKPKDEDGDIVGEEYDIAEIKAKFISDAAKELGYDAIIDKNSSQYENEIVVLDETKIKYPEDILEQSLKETPQEVKVSTPEKVQEEVKPLTKEEIQAEEEQDEMLLSGESDKRRRQGKFTKDGITYVRQKETEGVEGSQDEVVFAKGVTKKFKYKVIDRSQLQPSHLGGLRNSMHFIPEAQPKRRTDSGSIAAEQTIANNPNLKIAGENTNAYSGAPVVNKRGEVIQGNNRAAGLVKAYKQGTASNYKQDLINNAEKYGMTKEQVEAMEEPVLVRELDVNDTESIELGNYEFNDIETGNVGTINPVKIVSRMTKKIKEALVREAFKGEYGTTNESIRGNFDAIEELLVRYLNVSQYQALRDSNKNPSTKGIEAVNTLLQRLVFDGGDVALSDMFEGLPPSKQNTILKAAVSIISLPTDITLLQEFQNAIVGFSNFVSRGAKSVDAWSKEYDAFTNSSPRDIYTPLELEMIRLLSEKPQSEFSKMFKDYSVLVKGKKAEGMWGEDVAPITKTEAVETIFKIKQDEQQSKESGTGSPKKVSGEKAEQKQPQTPTEKAIDVYKRLSENNDTSTRKEYKALPESIKRVLDNIVNIHQQLEKKEIITKIGNCP